MVSLRKRKKQVSYKLAVGSDDESIDGSTKTDIVSEEEERSVYASSGGSSSDESESDIGVPDESENEESGKEVEEDDESVVSVLSATMPLVQKEISEGTTAAEENSADATEKIQRWNEWQQKLADIISRYFHYASSLDSTKESFPYNDGDRRGRRKKDTSDDIPLTNVYMSLPQLSQSTSSSNPSSSSSKGKKAASSDGVLGAFCPVPGCAKSKLPDNTYTAPSFKVYPSFKYHFNNHRHSLRDLISNWRSEQADHGSETLSQLVSDLDSLIETNNLPPYPPPPKSENGEEWLLLVTGPVKFLWPGEKELKVCTFTWNLEDLFQSQIVLEDDILDEAPKKRKKLDVGDSAMSREEALSMPIYEPRPYVPSSKHTEAAKIQLNEDLCQSKIKKSQTFSPEQHDASQKKVFVQTRYTAAKRSTLHSSAFSLDMFQSKTLDEEVARKRSVVLSVGQRPSAMRWLPSLDDQTQYVAVTTAPDVDIYVNGNPKDGIENRRGVVKLQIWSVGNLDKGNTPNAKFALMVNLVVDGIDRAHQFIASLDCFPVEAKSNFICVIAAVFGDGRLGIYSIPSIDNEGVAKEIWLEPLCQFSSPAISMICVSTYTNTSQSPKLAAGTMTGEIAIWNMNAVVAGSELDTEMIPPAQLYPAHNGAVSSLSWQPNLAQQDEEVFIASGGYDGQVLISSTSQPWRSTNYPGFHEQLWNGQSFVLSLFWAHDGVFFNGMDRIVRWVPVKRSSHKRTPSFIYDSSSCICVMNSTAHSISLDGSPFHGFIAAGTAEGSLHVCQVRRQCGKGLNNTQITEFQTESVKLSTTKESAPAETGQSSSMDGAQLTMVEFDESFRIASNTIPRTDSSTPLHIFPQSFSVVDVQWNPNPNLACQGWLSVAMEMGLVRIESVCRTELLDTKSVQKEPGQKRKQQQQK